MVCMKVFEDLVFFLEDTVPCTRTQKAVLKFGNGYGVSVLTGDGALATPEKPSEVAVIQFKDNGCYEIVYPSIFKGDILSSLSMDEVTHYMKLIQSLH